ncbi:tRNA glutamyl-Q(34) synthetase GluQRS [Comamonas sp. Y33R10-2]|uniref:tRNA glutamyl-Q(34) synthetase GluQRS n=1 Tax=Comamonas sp. Y33R10-2 TaxID=2853257 RepID=UPI001C5C9B1B|nr:tRNA glutamyl-Q(34) synthetase GluQRS [Comamonas sp. Y33R10-2]QXZ10796.1 tRNA glutamyl-Q(34) synthetase GluQRS [Comamonas sp. Y33R10-2]
MTAAIAPTPPFQKATCSGRYIGRFAPSPTGPLHAGSLVAALASWLDARAHGGSWLIRIEDIDPPRCQVGADEEILRQLAACGLLSDASVVWQSQRHALYEQALQQLQSLQPRPLTYPCGCTRKDIEAAWQAQGLAHERHIERPYPGTCRHGLHGKPARAWRFSLEQQVADLQRKQPLVQSNNRLEAIQTIAIDKQRHEWQLDPHAPVLHWVDRRLGPQQQNVQTHAGDFVLRRADGLWAYQLAVVVDDAAQGITDIVRGADLTDNTPRQLLLQHALGLPQPRYMHTPLVRMENGEKLSKQHGAPAVDVSRPLRALSEAALQLGLPQAPHSASSINESPASALPLALAFWVNCWRQTYNVAP